MNSLTKGIEYAIKNAIEEYIKCISSKYQEIKVEDLEKIWNDISENMKISVSLNSSSNTTENIIKSKQEPKPKPNNISTTDSLGCRYKFIKGSKQDQICGSKVKEGVLYCSRHKKFEGSEQKEQKAVPIAQRNTINSSSKNKPKSPEKSVARVIRKNKTLDKLWHPETCFVFRSDKELIVIGKCINDKLIPMVEEDLDECRKWGFQFSLSNDDDENDMNISYHKKHNTLLPSNDKSIYLVASSSSGSGQKFWECKVSGTKYVTKHGKIGKEPTTKDKIFDTYDDAIKEMNKMIKTKQNKGYTEDSSTTKKSKLPNSNNKNSIITPSDIEEVINDLQLSSDEEVQKTEKSLGKKFISNALGLNKKVEVEEEEEEEEEEEMLIDEDEDEEDEDEEE